MASILTGFIAGLTTAGLLPTSPFATTAHAAPQQPSSPAIASLPKVAYSTATWARPGAQYMIRHQGDFYICTVGFPATDATGSHLFVTAGHCGDPGDEVFRKVTPGELGQPANPLQDFIATLIGTGQRTRITPVGKFIAKISQSTQADTIDIAVVKLNDGSRIPGGYSQVPINIATPTLNMPICKVGSMSGRTCGNVTALHESFIPENYNSHIVGDKVQMCVISGDSGGPVITRGAAVGLVSAGEDVLTCNPILNGLYTPEGFMTDLRQGMQAMQQAIPGLHLT